MSTKLNNHQLTRILIASIVVGVVPQGHFVSFAKKTAAKATGPMSTKKSIAMKVRSVMYAESARVAALFRGKVDSYYAARLNKRCIEMGLPVPATDIDWMEIVKMGNFSQAFAQVATDEPDVALAKTVARDISTEIVSKTSGLRSSKFMK